LADAQASGGLGSALQRSLNVRSTLLYGSRGRPPPLSARKDSPVRAYQTHTEGTTVRWTTCASSLASLSCWRSGFRETRRKEHEVTSNAHEGGRILGSLRSADGSGVVRMEDRYAVEIDDLWSALTDPRRLARWYGEIDGDLRLGGEFQARLFASGWEGTGRVDACDPPRRLLLTMRDADPQPGQPAESVTEVVLAADASQTVLVLEERGLPLDLIAAYGAGIQVHVEDLAAHVAGRDRVDANARWTELFPAYEALAANIGS
jgi:uncharacterized protein YndB with AHSA1/START domain